MDLVTVDKLLTTTRSVRKRLNLKRPVPREIIIECLELALQAPTGSNRQDWCFMIVTDAEKRTSISHYYKQSFNEYAGSSTSIGIQPRQNLLPVASSARYLADNLHRVPVLVIPCYKGHTKHASIIRQATVYGSILPAAWSFVLALRSRGLGTVWTTLHLRYEKNISQLLGIPDNYTQGVLLPIAYYTGDGFKPAKRKPAEEVICWNTWDQNT